jgi:hypothetical protein
MPGNVAGHLISEYDNLKGTSCQGANSNSATISGAPGPIPVLEPARPDESRTIRTNGDIRHRLVRPVVSVSQKRRFATYKTVAKG